LVSQRDVVLIKVPYSDGSQLEQRPVIVVSGNAYNAMSEDFIAVAVTSNPRHKGYVVPISIKSMESGRIENGLIKVDVIGSYHKNRIIKPIGKVKPEILAEIKTALNQIFS
jgi:mRNA-degrading endonuclease toxin of MazEF toxin-antitoxin module